MDRATIKDIATRMLQHRSSTGLANMDEFIDLIYGHTLVEAVKSYQRRGAEQITTIAATATYTLSDLWRALDADYAFLGSPVSDRRIPIYTSQERWDSLELPSGDTNPARLLLFYDDPNWVIEVSPVPDDAYTINIPSTFYRAALPAAGTPDNNEAMAVVYGTALHAALIDGLDDIAANAQRGMNTQLSMLNGRAAAERWTPTSLPARRDF